jgi:hypothetical protein
VEPTQVVEFDDVRAAADSPAALVVDLEPPQDAPAVAVPPGVEPPASRAPQSCAFAQGVATSGGIRVGVLDAALAGWVAARIGPVRVDAPNVPPCEGLPPVDALVVPPSGRVIGLRTPAREEPTSGGAVEVHPIGEGARWWHVHAEGPGSVAFSHAEDPPTRLAVRVDEGLVAPAARTVDVPRGGAALIDFGGPITHAEAVQSDVVRLVASGTHLVVLSAGSTGALSADAVIRVGDQAPEPVRIEISGPPGPDGREVRVPIGGRRRLTADTEVREVWVASPEIAEVEVKNSAGGSRIIVHGRAPGRTALVVDGAAGPLLVPIAVGG